MVNIIRQLSEQLQTAKDGLARVCSRLPFGDLPGYLCATDMQKLARETLSKLGE